MFSKHLRFIRKAEEGTNNFADSEEHEHCLRCYWISPIASAISCSVR